MREYIDLNTIYPIEKIESETYSISRISLTKEQVMWEKLRNFREYWYVSGLKPNFDYIRLNKKGYGVMMSDTPMERNTNRDFVLKANGDVIVFGLGLGLIILPLLSDDNVKNITVVELYQDLIDLVEPLIKPLDKENKLKIVQGDCFNYTPDKKFDTIYFDIWIDICFDNYEEQKKLTRKFSKYLNRDNPRCYINAWMKDYYKKNKSKL